MLVVALMALATQAAVAAVSPSQQWMTSGAPNITGPGQTMTIGFGATGVTATLNVTAGTVAPENWPVNMGGPLTNAGANIPPFIEPEPPAQAHTIGQGVPAAPGGSQSAVVTFNKPVIAPILHVVNLDGSYLDIGGTTTSGAAITLNGHAANAELSQSGNRLNSDLNPAVLGGCDLNDGSNPNGSCGSLQLNGPGEMIQSFTMNNVGTADSWMWSLSFPTAPLTKQFSPARIPAGGTSQLTFTIANPANSTQPTLSPLDFTDVLPANVRLANGAVSSSGCGSPAVTDNGGGALAAGDAGVQATNISVVAGATCTITINVTSDTPSEPGDPYLNDNRHLSTTVANLVPSASTTLAVYAADLRIVKSTDGPVVPGEEATYELLVTNNGPSTAVNEVVSDTLPSGLTFVEASDGCSEAGGTVTCPIASLPAGESVTFTVTARADSGAECADLANTATVSGNNADPDLGNNSSTVRNCERRTNLRLTKDPSSARVGSGGQVMYTLVAENLGPSDDSNVTVTDPMQAGLSLVSAQPSQGSCSTTGGRVSCNLGRLRAGGSAQVLVTATVTAPGDAACGPAATITNTATVVGDAFDTNPDNNRDSAEICVTPEPPPTFDLVVSKSVNDRTPVVGQTVTYRVVVRNNGPATAPGTTMIDTLNADVSVVSVRASQGSCQRRIPMRCELGAIAAGERVTIRIRVKHREAGCRQRNAASATGDGTDSNPANNMDTVQVCPTKIRLRLTKVAERTVVRGGETFNYGIRVRNPTKGEARNVRVCDRLPSGLGYVSSRPTARRSGNQRCWTIRSLGAGKSRTFQVTVRAARGANGRKTNTATATSADTRRARAEDVVRVLGQTTPLTG